MFDGLFQPSHLLIILVVALFIFGPKKLPELGQGLGKGIRSFRDSMKAATDEPDKADTSQKHTDSTTK
jgi:sec-independent protein translocase protein TatA